MVLYWERQPLLRPKAVGASFLYPYITKEIIRSTPIPDKSSPSGTALWISRYQVDEIVTFFFKVHLIIPPTTISNQYFLNTSNNNHHHHPEHFKTDSQTLLCLEYGLLSLHGIKEPMLFNRPPSDLGNTILTSHVLI